MMAPTATFRFPLTPAHRVIDGIHHHTAHMRPATLPASASRFATRDIHVIDVTDLTNRGEAILVDPANFARRQLHQRISRFQGGKRRLLPGGPRDLATASRNQFNIVNVCAERNGAKRQRVSQLRRNIISRCNRRSNLKAIRREDVISFAIGVFDKSNARGAVRVVLRCRSPPLRRRACDV